MRKLLLINIFLLLLLSCVYFYNDTKINNHIAELRTDDSTSGLIANIDNQISRVSKKINVNSDKGSKLESVDNYGTFYNDVVQMIKKSYVENVDDKDFFEASLNGMLTSLDPHSAYFSKEDYEQLISDTQGEFSGLGIEVTMESSMVKVITPIDDSPAFKAGIRAGDLISSIDDKSVVGMSLMDAVSLMRGKDNKDRGVVKLTILRASEKEPIEFKIKRDLIKSDSVRGRAEGDIIYLRIASFTAQTYLNLIKEFNKVENEIGKNNVKGLVLDLRNNPGGLLDSSIYVADAFLDKGQKIVSIKGKNGIVMQEFSAQSNQDLIPGLPMVVLINEGSASASEIVAGALQDNNRAIILGTQSFGKGSVQSVIPLNNGGGIKLTIAKYYTPNDISIQAEGIKPDIEVKLAKIEEIDLSKWVSKENSLKGHLENKDSEDKKVSKSQLKSRDESMYNKDYQLARAIDLILGIDFYSHVGKAAKK